MVNVVHDRVWSRAAAYHFEFLSMVDIHGG